MNKAAEIIALAGVASLELSKDMTLEELLTCIEFLGLLRHNLEVIKHQKLFVKVEKKKEERKDGDEDD